MAAQCWSRPPDGPVGSQTGERFDLETLSEIFANGEPRVFGIDDNFWVQSTRLGGFATEQGGRQDDADELRDLLNGAGRLHAQDSALSVSGASTSSPVLMGCARRLSS